MTRFRRLSIPLVLLIAVDWLRVHLAPLPVPSFVLHGVSAERAPSDFWTITPDLLEQFLGVLEKAGRRTLDEAGVRRAIEGKLTREEAALAVVITVDDGFPSALERVAPALEKRGFKGHFFVMTAPRGPHLDDAGVRELARRHEVGCHTATHRSLLAGPRETPGAYHAALETEIAGSRKVIEATLGRPVTSFAYPLGETDATVEDAVRRAGFTLAFTTEPGYLEPGTSPFAVPRYQLSHDTPMFWIEEHLAIPERLRDQRLLLEGAALILLLLYLVLPDRSKALA